MSVSGHPVPRQEGVGFDRRRFLRRAALAGGVAWATPVVTTVALSRASASPCPAGTSTDAGSPSLAVPTSHDATHSPCYQACSEQRAVCEGQTADRFDACAQEAATDRAALMDCASSFRDELILCTTEFQACATPCF